jgi:hypothetical protein
MLSNWTKLTSLNTTQVKDIVKKRFGGSITQVYLNKCYSNKKEIAGKRNMAFAVDGTRFANVDLVALAQEIGCKRVKLHTAYLRGFVDRCEILCYSINIITTA